MGGSDTNLQSKNKDHHQDTKTPRKSKANSNAVLGGLGALVVRNPFLVS
jgi:hypothetical protein